MTEEPCCAFNPCTAGSWSAPKEAVQGTATTDRRVLVWLRRLNACGLVLRLGPDKVAESAVIVTEYGGVPEFLVAHGFGPKGKNPRTALDVWRKNGGKVR
jgi:hypothetical protein